jgi:predicted ATP-dependent endonuclease of OLD family
MIKNFRGIQYAELSGLGDTIIIAGQNGSGKSCVFDAIRMLKSIYGGYQANEYQHFFNEFQIPLQGGARKLRTLFNNQSLPINIEAKFKLREHEREFISNNAKELLEETIWQTVLPEAFQYGGYHKAMFSQQFRERQGEVDNRVVNDLLPLFKELSQSHIIGKVEINTDGKFLIADSILLKVILVYIDLKR